MSQLPTKSITSIILSALVGYSESIKVKQLHLTQSELHYNPLNIEIMEIKKEEWTAFAEFIARQSEHMCSQYWEDGTYICCPFSTIETIERAYAAFSIWKTCHSQSEVRKFYDVKFWEQSPDYDPREEHFRDMEKDVECNRKQEEIDICYEQQYPEFEWPDEVDNYSANREKQITRIAHELANKYGRLPLIGGKRGSWVSLVYPFYKTYELNSDERYLFVSEYYTQLYLNNGLV